MCGWQEGKASVQGPDVFSLARQFVEPVSVAFVGKIAKHCEEVTDPRVNRGATYPLIEMVFVALCGAICDCKSVGRRRGNGDRTRATLRLPQQFAAWCAGIVSTTEGLMAARIRLTVFEWCVALCIALGCIAVVFFHPALECACVTAAFALIGSALLISATSCFRSAPYVGFAGAAVMYLLLVSIPDEVGFSPRRLGPELPTRALSLIRELTSGRWYASHGLDGGGGVANRNEGVTPDGVERGCTDESHFRIGHLVFSLALGLLGMVAGRRVVERRTRSFGGECASGVSDVAVRDGHESGNTGNDLRREATLHFGLRGLVGICFFFSMLIAAVVGGSEIIDGIAVTATAGIGMWWAGAWLWPVSNRWFKRGATIAFVVYICLVMIPDSAQRSPRLDGPEITTRVVRWMCAGRGMLEGIPGSQGFWYESWVDDLAPGVYDEYGIHVERRVLFSHLSIATVIAAIGGVCTSRGLGCIRAKDE